MDACIVCGISGELKRCARCKIVRYCGREHQIEHWKTHKLECGKEKSASGAESAHVDNAYPEAGGAAAAATNVEEADDGPILFDKRPVNLIDFPKPASYNHNDIIQFCFDGLQKDGFVVIDGILNEEECNQIEQEINMLENTGRMKTGKLAGGETSGMKGEMVVNQTIRSDKMVWLDNVEPDYPQINRLITDKMDGYVLPLTAMFNDEVIISGRTKAMVACYPGDGTCYHRHVDNPGGDGRIITCIFYTNRDWDPQEHGGVLRILPSSRPGQFVDIAPVMNRMIMFWSDRRTPHEVHPTFTNRYAITMWYFDAEQRAKANEKQLQKELEKVENEVVMLNIKTKGIEKQTMEKKIETTATNAVNMLSPEELEALTQVIEASPDPRSFLTSLGIAQVLQEKVLSTIAERKQLKNN